MGGGASQMQGVEDLLATTYMIGKAIAAISFPGMYRIYDFHSPLAPKLKNATSFAFFSHESDDEGGGNEEYEEPDISKYSHCFKVTVGQDNIYIEDVLYVNEAGWTALHACCMSFLTKEAGALLVDEIVELGGDIDVKTKSGTGSFNSGWTPLHM